MPNESLMSAFFWVEQDEKLHAISLRKSNKLQNQKEKKNKQASLTQTLEHAHHEKTKSRNDQIEP